MWLMVLYTRKYQIETPYLVRVCTTRAYIKAYVNHIFVTTVKCLRQEEVSVYDTF